MGKDELILRIVGLMTVLRDDLERMNFKQEMKKTTNRWLNEANKYLDMIGSGSEQSNKEFGELVTHYHKITRLNTQQEKE